MLVVNPVQPYKPAGGEINPGVLAAAGLALIGGISFLGGGKAKDKAAAVKGKASQNLKVCRLVAFCVLQLSVVVLRLHCPVQPTCTWERCGGLGWD